MSKMHHTPGPWQQDDHPLDIHHAATSLVQGEGTKDEWVGVGPNFGDGDPYGAGQEHTAYCHPANAPLIAAAPTLLAALKDLLGEGRLLDENGVCRCCGRDYEGDIPANDECLGDTIENGGCPGMIARAAIALVEG